jgi:hypothetical protein
MPTITITPEFVRAEKNLRRVSHLCNAIVRELPKPRHLGLRPGTPEWDAWLVLERVAVARLDEAEAALRKAYAGLTAEEIEAVSAEINMQLDGMDDVAPRAAPRGEKKAGAMYQVDLDGEMFATSARDTAVAACEKNATGGTVIAPDGGREWIEPKAQQGRVG